MEHWLYSCGALLGMYIFLQEQSYGSVDLVCSKFRVSLYAGRSIVPDTWELGALGHDGEGIRSASQSYA